MTHVIWGETFRQADAYKIAYDLSSVPLPCLITFAAVSSFILQKTIIWEIAL